jgi:hypothetical protein
MAQKLNPIKGNTLLWILGLSFLLVGFFLKPLIQTLQNKGQSGFSNFSIGQKRVSSYEAYYPAAIELKGFDKPSEWFERPKRARVSCLWEGPSETIVEFEDGVRIPIYEKIAKGGKFRF